MTKPKVMTICAVILVVTVAAPIHAQEGESVPELSGVWDGGPRSRPINGPNMPWTSENFPVLNERGLAFQQVFDEAISPKYDCVPSTPPALVYDPYMMEVVQWPDRVLFRYEKDDQLRTVWLDGREPTPMDYSLQGVSVGHYEGGSLHVTTTHYTFDVTGFDDYNGIPSSQMKKITERYWREGDQLKITLTVEDDMFLREPTSFTTQWNPGPDGYQLQSYACDPEVARHPVKFLVPKYK